MLDDIYILQDYAIIVNNKILNIDTSCVIRRIVTYHYMVLVEVKITHMKLITKNKRKEEGDKDRFKELWGRSRFFNDETQKNRKQHALRG